MTEGSNANGMLLAQKTKINDQITRVGGVLPKFLLVPKMS